MDVIPGDMLSIITQILVLAAPGLHCEHLTLDAGKIRTGPVLQRSFTLENRLQEDVHVLKAVSGCGCAKPTLDKPLLKPGEQASLVMSVNTLTQPAGKQTWKTTITFQNGSRPPETLELRLQAELIREVSITPPELAISTESTARQLLKLVDIRPTPLKLLSATTSHPAMRVKLDTPRPGLPLEQSFELQLEENYPVGERQETIMLKTDDVVMPWLTVPIKIHKRAKSQIRQSPETLEIQRHQPGVANSRLVQLRRADGKLLEIDQVECNDKALSLKWSTGEGPVQTMRIATVSEPQEESTTVLVRFKSADLAAYPVVVHWRR